MRCFAYRSASARNPSPWCRRRSAHEILPGREYVNRARRPDQPEESNVWPMSRARGFGRAGAGAGAARTGGGAADGAGGSMTGGGLGVATAGAVARGCTASVAGRRARRRSCLRPTCRWSGAIRAGRSGADRSGGPCAPPGRVRKEAREALGRARASPRTPCTRSRRPPRPSPCPASDRRPADPSTEGTRDRTARAGHIRQRSWRNGDAPAAGRRGCTCR
jgi:hypothetical protein